MNNWLTWGNWWNFKCAFPNQQNAAGIWRWWQPWGYYLYLVSVWLKWTRLSNARHSHSPRPILLQPTELPGWKERKLDGDPQLNHHFARPHGNSNRGLHGNPQLGCSLWPRGCQSELNRSWPSHGRSTGPHLLLNMTYIQNRSPPNRFLTNIFSNWVFWIQKANSYHSPGVRQICVKRLAPAAANPYSVTYVWGASTDDLLHLPWAHTRRGLTNPSIPKMNWLIWVK